MSPPASYLYGLISPDDLVGMAGQQILQAMLEGRLPQAPICETLNFWLTEVGEGTAVFEGDPDHRLRGPGPAMHGGWALTLMDIATAAAGWTVVPLGESYVTIETKCNFSRPITLETGRGRAEGKASVQAGESSPAKGWIRNTAGRLLAHGTSTLLVMSPVATG